MKKLIKKEGFALISVFIISVLLAGIIGFTYVSVSRALNLKNITYNSKKSFTVADAGLEQMINIVQNYHFDTIAEYLAFNDKDEQGNGLPMPFIYKLKNDFDNTINNISSCSYISNVDKEKLRTAVPDLFKEYFKSIVDSSYYPLRAKYFYNFDRVDGTSLYDSSNKKITLETHPDLSNITLKSSDFGLNIFQSNLQNEEFSYGCEDCIENILKEIYNDVEDAYNNWANYVIERVNALINSLGGLSGGSSNCPTENLDNIIIPYDIDYPVVEQDKVDYEGVIVRTADIVEMKTTSSDIEPIRKVIISAVSYVFNKPVPKSIFDSSIKDKLTLVCPRVEDAEYKKYYLYGSSSYPQIDHKIYVNALDVDETNLKIKNSGLSYEFSPVKRGIRAEFQIPFIWSETNKQNLFVVVPSTTINLTSIDTYWLQFPSYLIATNNDITLPNTEHIRGHVRSNNHIIFNGETSDVMIAKKGVTYNGKFIFTYKGVTYTVDFSNWNEKEDYLPISPIPPSNSGIVLSNNKIKISKDNTVIQDDEGIIRYKSWYIDLNADSNFNKTDLNGDGKIDPDEQDRMFLAYTKGTLPLVDPTTTDSLINKAKQDIYNATYGTDYYVSTGGSGYIEIDVQNDKVKYRKNGTGGWTTLNISSNPGSVLYVDGDVYFKGGGFLDGKLTVYATGDIHFEGGPVRYKDAPKLSNDNQFPSNTDDIDMLGVITPKKVYLTNNSSNSEKIDVNILAGDGIVSDKNNPNKIQINGSISFYNTYNGEYRYELLNYDYYLLKTKPPMFPIIRPEPEPTSTTTTYQYTIQTQSLSGRVKEIYFSRRLWREMVSPP